MFQRNFFVLLPKRSRIFLHNSRKKIKKLLTNEEKLINQLNDAMNSSDFTNPSTYYSIDKFNKWLKKSQKVYNWTNLLHLNISSLPYNYEQLHTLLVEIIINFDIIGITETRLRTGQKALNNIGIEKYVIEHTTTDASCGGALLYIKEGITYKVQNELEITKSKELESVFIEIQNNHKRKNVIVGCIYQHPRLHLSTSLSEVFWK